MSKKKLFNISLESEDNLENIDIGVESFFGIFKNKPKITLDDKGIQLLKQTYLNDKWVSQQKFKSGTLKYKYDHLLTSNLDASLNNCVSTFNDFITKNERLLKQHKGQLEPIKQFILSNPDVKPEVLKNKVKNIKATELVSPDKEDSSNEIPLATKDNIKQVAELLLKATQVKAIDTKSISNLVDENVNDWYGSGSLRSKLSNTDSAAILIEYDHLLLVDVSGDIEEYIGPDGFDMFIKANLIYPLMNLLNQSIR